MSESTLFVVRVWRQWTAFRASVRRVDDEDTRWFSAPLDLARYLEASAGESESESAPASDGEEVPKP